MAIGKVPKANPRGFRSNEAGEVTSQDNSYGFSRAVRGYDPKEVDEYIDNLLDNYRNAQRVLDQNREEFESEKELISCEVDGLKTQKAEWEAKLAEYQKVIDDLTNQMMNVSGDEAAAMNMRLQQQIKDMEKKEAENQEIIDNLSNQLGESQKIINTLNVKSNSNTREVEELNAKIRELQTRVDSASEAEATRLQLTTENLKLSTQVQDLERSNEQQSVMVDRLSRENEDNMAQVNELSGQLVSLQDRLSDYDRMREEYDVLRRETDESEATIENLRNQLLVVNDLAKENEELRGELHNIKGQVSEYDSVIAEKAELENVVNDLRLQTAEQQTMVDEKTRVIDDYVAHINKLEEAMSYVQYQFEETKKLVQ